MKQKGIDIMLTVNDIAMMIEAAAPLSLAYSWDNPGLLVGSRRKEVSKMLITLDTNLFTVNEAIEQGCDMIVSHHPILFRGTKKADYDDPIGRLLELLIKNDIAVYAAHANMDNAPEGINARLAEIFELEDVKVLEPDEKLPGAGLGRFGKLQKSMTAVELCKLVKERLDTPAVRAAGDMIRPVSTLCVASGSCAECIDTAIEKGCDAIITGDLKYHETMDAAEKGIFIIDAGHYPTEVMVKDIFSGLLKNKGAEIVISRAADVFKFI